MYEGLPVPRMMIFVLIHFILFFSLAVGNIDTGRTNRMSCQEQQEVTTVMILSFWTDKSGKTVHQTAPRGAVWSGSTLFACPSASFGCIILHESHLAQILGCIQQIFWVSELLGLLQ